MNPISQNVSTGTIGELLVQTRLLQYGVQAAPPIKDSGNDLIALRGTTIKAIQVKTRTDPYFSGDDLPELYHLVAFVYLVGEDYNIYLDQSEVFIVPKEHIGYVPLSVAKLGDFRLTPDWINHLFPPMPEIITEA